MTRSERNEFNYIKKSLKQLNPGYGSTLTIRVNAGHEYKQALHDLYTGFDFHPAAIAIDNHRFDDNERIMYIKGIVVDGYHWTQLYTSDEKKSFENALK